MTLLGPCKGGNECGLVRRPQICSTLSDAGSDLEALSVSSGMPPCLQFLADADSHCGVFGSWLQDKKPYLLSFLPVLYRRFKEES